jgi:hypothetical protein
MKEPFLVSIGCFGLKQQTTTFNRWYRHGHVDTFMQAALSQLDQVVLLGLSEAPLLIDQLSINFHFRDSLPRNLIASAWIQAAYRLFETVEPSVEAALAKASNPFASQVDVSPECRHGRSKDKGVKVKPYATTEEENHGQT